MAMKLTRAAVMLRKLVRPEPPPWTQQSLAKELGVTQQAVSAWLRGTTRPSDETRVRLETLLGVSLADWTVEVPTEPASEPTIAVDDTENDAA